MRKSIVLFLALSGTIFPLSAQISFRTEYIGRSSYKDIDNNKNGGRGNAQVYSGSAQIPLRFTPMDDGRVKAWGVSLSSSFTSLGNNAALQGLAPDKIFNNHAGVFHIRPVARKWSLMATAGAGIYAPHTNLGKTRFDEVLFDAAVLFVWHLRHNLEVGFGVAANSSFGYPMGFPALYLKWNTTGRFFIDLTVIDGANLTAGVRLKEWFNLSLVTDMNGSVAMQKLDGKKQMFSHSYITVSLQPEFKIGKNVTIPLRAGFSADRLAYYEERTLRAFFKAFKRDFDPGFLPSLYLSAGINISF